MRKLTKITIKIKIYIKSSRSQKFYKIHSKVGVRKNRTLSI